MSNGVPRTEIKFYPVLHLLTGPPGLTRNGGIWKRLKAGLREISHPPRMMVQALHFTPYNLSRRAWEGWFPSDRKLSRLAHELSSAYGPRRDIFVDSGGFQLLHAAKLDLSRWGLTLDQESVFRLQTLYRPQRVASLDSPIPPPANDETAARLAQISIRNAVWLAANVSTGNRYPRPYLVVHGRTPDEVRRYLNKLEIRLPRGWLRSHEYGLALGSQVPLSGNPELVISNIEALLGWMENETTSDTDVHVFGVGDGIMGAVVRGSHGRDRPLSYDNSTYVQNAFRLRMFDNSTRTYVDLDPTRMPECHCAACDSLSSIGKAGVTELLSTPAYSGQTYNREQLYKSDIFALVALHNMRWWRSRLALKPRRHRVNLNSPSAKSSSRLGLGYKFPLPQFEPASSSLLLLPCSKWRPYGESPSHRRVKRYLAGHSLLEGRDYDRITLSGMYGPVHWKDELDPAILSYDFPLGPHVSVEQLSQLKFKTATILGVLNRKYDSIVAVLRSSAYASAFGPVTAAFGGSVVREPSEALRSL